MKANIVTSILIAFLSIVNISAVEATTKVYTNAEVTEFGSIKEFTSYNPETSQAISKSVYQYDMKGNIQTKVLYKWDSNVGWIGTQKYDYNYNNDKQIVNLIYTEWDNNLNTWSTKSKQLVHVYSTEGDFLAIEQIEMNNDLDNLVTQK